MALWQIEITMETEQGDPNKWDWETFIKPNSSEEVIIEVKAIQAEKSWSEEYRELSEYVGQLEGEKQ